MGLGVRLGWCMSGSHLQDGHSICCHSNQLTTEEGDAELSIQVVSKNNIFPFMVLILCSTIK